LYFFKKKVKEKNTQSEGEKNFLEFLSEKKTLPSRKERVSLIAVGDVSFSRAGERIIKKEKDINYPFLKIKDYLKSGDIVFANLETPITSGPEIPNFAMIFRSNPGTEKALKQAGFSLLSLANNHTLNFAEKGLKDTLAYLESVGIQYVGAGENRQKAYQPVYIEKKGIKFAFLAYSDGGLVPDTYEAGENHAGIAFINQEEMMKAVRKARAKADFVIVSLHAGTEYTDTPNDLQVNFAHAAVDAGADLIIGHHPHVVQPLEQYRGKYIFYSLGNFVFDQPQKRETREGLAIKVYFSKEKIEKISLLPVVMENLAQPRMASEDEADKILARLKFSLKHQDVYVWNSLDNNFQKQSRAVVCLKKSEATSSFSKHEQADLDKDSVLEEYILENGRLMILENSKILWQSPPNWWIDNFVLADLNNDDIVDINLSLWKAGNFGSSQPFWIKENDMSVKNHFFILNLIDDSVKEVWGSSNLSRPNCEFQIADVDGDGKNDLVVIEGDYSLNPECQGEYLAFWKWNGWGVSNEWRSRQGNFANLEIEKIDQKSFILVDSF